MLAKKVELMKWPDVSVPKSASIIMSSQPPAGESGAMVIYNADQAPMAARHKDVRYAFVHSKQMLQWIGGRIVTLERQLMCMGQAMPQKARVKYKSTLHGTLVVSGNSIPRQGRLPPYKSWSYLMQNELANEVGGRIFYTDATGTLLCCLSTTYMPAFRSSERMS